MAVSVAGGVAPPPLLILLSDGEVRSGESLALALGQTRAAVWKAVQRLRALGIGVEAMARRGYRLSEPVELLRAERVLAEMSTDSRQHLRNLEMLFEVDSTSTRLLAANAPPPGLADVCSSELQHAGRGRLGRRWIAPFGSGLAISVAWCFSDAARALPALSLGVGVAVARALARAGAAGIALKWPNDIWYRDRKVGGVLVEIRSEAGGPAHVVIGVGLNVRLPQASRQEIEARGARAAAVADACSTPPSRNRIAGTFLDELLSMLVQIERTGFAALRDKWAALDALSGRSVQLQLGDKITAGIARGADADGALLLEVDERLQRFVSGEASLRLIEGEL
jgi:BirA family biotin operon repressor/biotin-[acetyl-CoA-carboxylase] ligase